MIKTDPLEQVRGLLSQTPSRKVYKEITECVLYRDCWQEDTSVMREYIKQHTAHWPREVCHREVEVDSGPVQSYGENLTLPSTRSLHLDVSTSCRPDIRPFLSNQGQIERLEFSGYCADPVLNQLSIELKCSRIRLKELHFVGGLAFPEANYLESIAEQGLWQDLEVLGLPECSLRCNATDFLLSRRELFPNLHTIDLRFVLIPWREHEAWREREVALATEYPTVLRGHYLLPPIL